MRGLLEYYYGFYVENLTKKNSEYHFKVGDDSFILFLYDQSLSDLYYSYELNKFMLSEKITVMEMIPTFDNLFFEYDGRRYILLKSTILNLFEDDFNFNEAIKENFFDVVNEEKLNSFFRSSWLSLWKNKVDYFEKEVKHNWKKFPIISESSPYFIGLAENAISYLVHVFENNNLNLNLNLNIGISHRIFDSNSPCFSFFNPCNLIVDYKIRDLAEFCKISFFIKNYSCDFSSFFKLPSISAIDMTLLYARLLFPNYYFDQCEKFVYNQSEEMNLLKVINQSSKYESFLSSFSDNMILSNEIKRIEWLCRRENI